MLHFPSGTFREQLRLDELRRQEYERREQEQSHQIAKYQRRCEKLEKANADLKQQIRDLEHG